MITAFVWKYKIPNVKKTTVIGPNKRGGLGMPEFVIANKTLKVAWIKIIVCSEQAVWKYLSLALFETFCGLLLFECNFNVNLLKSLDCPRSPAFLHRNAPRLAGNNNTQLYHQRRNKRRNNLE